MLWTANPVWSRAGDDFTITFDAYPQPLPADWGYYAYLTDLAGNWYGCTISDGCDYTGSCDVNGAASGSGFLCATASVVVPVQPASSPPYYLYIIAKNAAGTDFIAPADMPNTGASPGFLIAANSGSLSYGVPSATITFDGSELVTAVFSNLAPDALYVLQAFTRTTTLFQDSDQTDAAGLPDPLTIISSVGIAPDITNPGGIGVTAVTSGDLTLDLPAIYVPDDVFVASVVLWAPNSAGAISDIPTPSGWTEIAQIQNGDDGRIAWFWRRVTGDWQGPTETAPTFTRPADWDTGTDTCFAGRIWRITGARTTGTPWDEADPTVAYNTADQPFDAVTVSGQNRLVVQFGAAQSNHTFGSSTGWTAMSGGSTVTGTDASFRAFSRDRDTDTTADATTGGSTPGAGFYAYLGVSFIPAAITTTFNVEALCGAGQIAATVFEGGSTQEVGSQIVWTYDGEGVITATLYMLNGVNYTLACSGAPDDVQAGVGAEDTLTVTDTTGVFPGNFFRARVTKDG